MLLGKKVDVRKSLIYTNVPDSTCLSLPGTPAALVVTSSLQASARFAKGQPYETQLLIPYFILIHTLRSCPGPSLTLWYWSLTGSFQHCSMWNLEMQRSKSSLGHLWSVRGSLFKLTSYRLLSIRNITPGIIHIVLCICSSFIFTAM